MTPDFEALFPEDISDETAFALCEILHELLYVCESRYLGQLLRYSETQRPEPFDPERPWKTEPPAE